MTADPQLHPLVAGFSDAELYDRGRPHYGAPVIEVIVSQLALAPGAPVLELGAGTGQLSRALVDAGLSLTAVEPLASMRRLLGAAIGEERVRAGAAEQVPLPDRSVDAVLAADSFHWFDESRALAEIHRVLRPGGGVAILRTAPLLETSWSTELGELIAAARPAHPAFGERGAAAALEEDDAFGPVSEALVESEQVLDRSGVLAYLSSLSWVGTMTPEQRAALIEDAQRLLERHDVGELRHRVQHSLWTARLR
jgi:SAM-dependent methyltransferase